MNKPAENIFYPNQVIVDGEQKYFYNIITSGIFVLDDISHKIITGDVKDIINTEQYKETVKFMENNFIIKTEKNDSELEKKYNKAVENKRIMNPTGLTLMISQDCNLRCTYCYGEDGKYSHKGMMSYDTAKAAIDYFLKYAVSDKLSICFFGGEPLLNFKLIKKIVNYLKEIERNSSKHFSFCMTTNGTLINQEIEEFIIQNKIGTTISIDGNREVQDSNRFYANKHGSYDEVIRNTERLRKTNLVSVRATISPQNLDVLKSVDHLIDLGFRKIAWSPALNLMNEQDMEQMTKSEKQMIYKIEQLIKEGDIDRVKKYGTILNMLKKLSSDGIRTKSCGSGTNLMTVNIDGDIYPCHRFVGVDTMKLGNVFSNSTCSNEQFYSNVEMKKFNKCKSCIGRNACAGSCIHENYEFNNDITVPVEVHCKYIKEIFLETIKLYIHLDEEIKDKILNK